jgi:hypothetical protein
MDQLSDIIWQRKTNIHGPAFWHNLAKVNIYRPDELVLNLQDPFYVTIENINIFQEDRQSKILFIRIASIPPQKKAIV